MRVAVHGIELYCCIQMMKKARQPSLAPSVVYLLESTMTRRTYIGCTNDPTRRLRQHNCEIKGGARATRGHTWRFRLTVHGFPTRRAALSFERAAKRRRMRKLATPADNREAILRAMAADHDPPLICKIG
jgi:structure-specific endonuclease subunit SLX1